jgi:hypothetical protein
MATTAVFLALGGSSYAAVHVTGKDVANASLTGKDVKDGTITGADVKNGSRTARDFKAGALPSGPKGDPGEPGQKGDKGDKGDPGKDAVIGPNSITGAQVDESTLGMVPNAGHSKALTPAPSSGPRWGR